MSRLQKKCLIASGTLHALLVLILLVGPAFFLKKESEKPVDRTVLTMIPDKVVDNALNPASQPPPAQIQTPAQPEPPTPEPEPEPEPPVKTPEPEPVQEPVRPTRVEPVKPVEKKVAEPKPTIPEPKPVEKKQEPVKPPARTVVPIKVTTAVKKDTTKPVPARPQPDISKAISSLNKVDTALADNIKQSLNFGPVSTGTAGVYYTSYDSLVRSTYDRAWHAPSDLAPSSASVGVKLVINRDGTVKSAVITRKSGNAKLDQSIQDLISNKVKTIGKPFPDGATEATREYTLEFNLNLRSNG